MGYGLFFYCKTCLAAPHSRKLRERAIEARWLPKEQTEPYRMKDSRRISVASEDPIRLSASVRSCLREHRDPEHPHCRFILGISVHTRADSTQIVAQKIVSECFFTFNGIWTNAVRKSPPTRISEKKTWPLQNKKRGVTTQHYCTTTYYKNILIRGPKFPLATSQKR